MYLDVTTTQGRGYFGKPSSTPSVITRFAPDFNKIDQYAKLGQESIFVGDFEVQITLTRQDVARAIFGGTDIRRIIEHVDGRIEIANNQSVTITGVFADISVGEVFKLKLERLSGVIYCYVNDVLKGTGNYTEDVGILNIGASWNDALTRGGLTYNYFDSNGNIFNMYDGWINTPNMANTGTGVDGTYIAPTELMWKEVTL